MPSSARSTPSRFPRTSNLGAARPTSDQEHAMAVTSSVADKLARGFNLSRWAITHGNFTAFLLVLLLAAGAYSLVRIGQKFDPDFTFRVMVVQVSWPGASVREMQDQVVDKIERKLQETPSIDFIRSYTRAGFASIFVNLK